MASLVLLFAAAAQQASSPDRNEIRALIARGTLPHVRHPDFERFRQALDDLYRDSSYASQWLAGSGTTRAVLADLAAAPSHGPEADVDWLDGEAKGIAAGERAPERIPRVDVALTCVFPCS